MMEKCKSDTKKLYCNGKDMQRYQAAEHANLKAPVAGRTMQENMYRT